MATEVFASYDNDGTLNEEKLRANLKRAGGTTADDGDLEEEEPGGFPIKVKMDGYIFEIDKYGNITKEGEIASGGGEEQGDEPPVAETISEDTSYVGYYADLDGDEQADGIIYADLAYGSGGQKKWVNNDWSVFEYPSKEENDNVTYKKYTIEDGKEGSGFGEEYKKEMIKVADGNNEGADRFYVMDLNDFDEITHTWYKKGYGISPTDIKVYSYTNDFGKGKENTEYWIGENGKYGTVQDATEDDNDMWKIIKEKLNDKGKTWFVPSKSEWSAFGYMCYNTDGINMLPENYEDFGLSVYYWSSSMVESWMAACPYFSTGGISRLNINVNGGLYVRLSTTF